MYEPGVTAGGPSGARLAAIGSHAAAVFALARDLSTARTAAAGRAAARAVAAPSRGPGAVAQPAATAATVTAASASAADRARGTCRPRGATRPGPTRPLFPPFTGLASPLTGTPPGGGSGPRRTRRP